MGELEKYVASIPTYDVVETLVVKHKFYKSLHANGVPHPTTYFVDDGHLDTNLPTLRFPVFVKPSISPLFYATFGQKGFVAYNRWELQKYLQVTAKANIEVMVQQIIPGPPTNLYVIHGYFDKLAQPIVTVARQKLRQPSDFSNSSASVSIPITQVLKQRHIIIDYLTSLKYHGIFSANFKQDARDGRFKLLEVNARSTWNNSFLPACGVNHILTAYREAIGEEITEQDEYETGKYCINILNDLRSIRAMLRKDQVSLREVLMSYLMRKDWHVFDNSDPMPFIKQLTSQMLGYARA
jgi:predicted ATP-grasp superfamily ATP-dependent carboligase